MLCTTLTLDYGQQILISGWHQAKIDFFSKKFHLCHILTPGGPVS